jgi:hypothetical protein
MDEVVTLDAGERASKLRRGSPRADDAVRLATL